MQSSNPQIIYAVVVRGSNVVLSEYSIAKGNYIAFAKTIISKVNQSNAKKSFNYEQYEFHILVEDGFSFLIMAERGLKMRIAFACLEDMKQKFFQMFQPQQRDQAISYGLNSQFSIEQKNKIEYYNSPQADKLRMVSDNIQQTKEVMMENLDKLLERGEKIDILVEKTNVMVNISTSMKENATTLRRQMWWRNKKMTIILVLVGLLAIYIIMVIACGGFAMHRCFGSSD
ncbi:unnamed protein product (macronuclear) [Paramecium tetraurelia]|uniref:Uncharacterized protein n=1 Tax=Paramecium tetraurelia TaxID=5888 RepID=A0EB89_PARTE|nr:uncharacterized protein GSPATT00025290001 [Paramecium tetraurelia]CAK92556.1 unnamed protein product [Paramecium tetraurelia]|eukprot:XP_001459953.1 hypothetical protein (macronuclear) [Paramecium tetraurelia strain d4-2]